MTLQDQITNGLSDLESKIQATEAILQTSISDLNTRLYALETKNTGPTIITKLQFENRFTFEELVAIEEASATDAGIRVLKSKQSKADYIDLVDENTQLGILYLVSKNLLTQERADEILTIPE